MIEEKRKKIIVELIERKDEGSYWDYKQEFHKDNGDLVHDIICLANNTENREAYIIFGVEDKTGKIVGIEHSPTKKNKQNIINVLRDVDFAGGVRPQIDLVAFKLDDHEICGLIIKKSPHVPLYLASRYRNVSPFQIYTRVGDNNTPKNSQADINDIEKLWKIRFGLLPSPVERALAYIKDIGGWQQQKETHWYYRTFPEFTIITAENPDTRIGNPAYAAVHSNARSYWDILQVKYHQTVIMEYSSNGLDGCRACAIHPNMDCLFDFRNNNFEYPSNYLYYFENSPELLLSHFLNAFMPQGAKKFVWAMHLEYVAIFYDESEQERYIQYLKSHIAEFKQELPQILKTIPIGYGYEFSERERLYVKQHMTVSRAVVDWLERFRGECNEPQ